MLVKTLVVVGGINVKILVTRNIIAIMIKRGVILILVPLEVVRKDNL